MYVYMKCAFKGSKYVVASAPVIYTAYTLNLLNPYTAVVYGISIIASAMM